MIAFVYSGQGQVMSNMGADFYAHFPEVRHLYDSNDSFLRLKNIAFQEDEQKMMEKDVHQELIVQFGLAVTKALVSKGIKPDLTFGLSLGEFPALAAASTLSEEAIMRFVHYRSEAMEYACDLNQGSMVAVIGNAPNLELLCEEICQSGEYIILANDNSPKQKVLSGTKKACDLAYQWCKEHKIRAIPLTVNGAFHSELMQPALEKLAPYYNLLSDFSLKCPVLHNTTALPLEIKDIKKVFSEHLIRPVLFMQSILAADALGVDCYIVIGPGKAPESFIKQTLGKEKKVYVINTAQDVEYLVKEMRGDV